MSILNEMMDYEDELNEARPYSRSQSAMDKAKGKVKGMFGSGQIEQGAQEVGAEANRLWADFKRYIGKKYGKAQSSVPYADVAQFFQGNGLDTKFLGNNQRRSFTPKDVGNALLAAAREYMNDHRDQEVKQPEENKPQPQQAPQSTGGNAPSIPSEIQSLSPAERDQLLRMLA